MADADRYRIRAAELHAQAQSETNPRVRSGYEDLAHAYLLLAEHAERNAEYDVIFEPPPPKLNV